MTERVYDIAFIGAGQGGGRIAAAFHERGYDKILAVNTAPQDLKRLVIPEENKFAIDGERQGAGKDPAVASSLVKSNSEKILLKMKDLFGKCDRIIICVGAGGGTGTGSCEPLIEISKKYMKSIGFSDPKKKVGVVCSIPTDGELRSSVVARNAEMVIGRMMVLSRQGDISPTILVDNNKIREIFPGLTMRDFWPTANKSVAEAFDAFNTIPCMDSPFASFDPSDYESVMEAGGFMTMGSCEVDGKITSQSLVEGFENTLKKNIVCDTFPIATSIASACIICCSPDVTDSTPGLMDEIDDALDEMSARLKSKYIHRGVYEDDVEGVTIYSITGGLDLPKEILVRLARLSK